MQFKPYRHSEQVAYDKANPPDLRRAKFTAAVAVNLRDIALFVAQYPTQGKLTVRDEDDNLWEITIEKSDVKKAAGEL